ncbi:SLATT domain-containing protein [Pseudoalteromonas distincta]|uniref:SLATT domain-containing protein n=1 Tax=Pseudoalteromonas distincta TaxID=77608 RepID=UPI0039E81E2A
MDNKEQLNNRIWRTKGSRFNAYRRLAKKNSTLTFVTSCSSIHLLAISILQLTNLVSISVNQSRWLSFISIIISIIILAYGLYENGKEHGLKSERHHSCGIELDGCYSKLQFIEDNETSKVIDIADEYNQITAKYLLNHETIDDLYFKLQNPDDFPNIAKISASEKFKIRLTYKHYDAIVGFLFVIIPVLVSLVIMLC